MMLTASLQSASSDMEWMTRNRILRDVVTQDAVSLSVQSYSSTQSSTNGEQQNASQLETTNAVNAGAEGSQAKSSREKSDSSKESAKSETSGELTIDEKRELIQLQSIDRNVRAHEKAHLNAAQGIALSGADYSYQLGPDDKRYAVAGEVSIDTSKASGPEKTIDKGNQIIRAALAPANPSPQDLSVAANAEQIILEAQAELMRATYASNQQLKQAEAEAEENQNSGNAIDERV